MTNFYQQSELNTLKAEVRSNKHTRPRAVVSFRIDDDTAAEWTAYCKIQSLYFNLDDSGSGRTVQKMDKGDLTAAALSQFMFDNPITRKIDKRLFQMHVDRIKRRT